MAYGVVQVLKDELRVPEPGNDGPQSTEDVIRARIAKPARIAAKKTPAGWCPPRRRAKRSAGQPARASSSGTAPGLPGWTCSFDVKRARAPTGFPPGSTG